MCPWFPDIRRVLFLNDGFRSLDGDLAVCAGDEEWQKSDLNSASAYITVKQAYMIDKCQWLSMHTHQKFCGLVCVGLPTLESGTL